MAHILIVDDDATIRQNTRRLLEAENHAVTEAQSGEQALAILADEPIELVLMDVVMPQKGGIEVIMEIHERHPRIPTTIMSGKVPLGTEAVSALMERYGARAVLSKPFTRGELLASIEAALKPRS